MKIPYKNVKSFSEDHMKRYSKLKDFLVSTKGEKKRPADNVMRQLERPAAIFLHANNVSGRVAFVRAADRHLSELIEGGSTHKYFYFVTLTPIEFVMPIEEAAAFHPKALRKWVREVLGGFHFLGMIEAAMYGAVPGREGAAVAWHVHAIVWGTGEARLRRVTDEVNSRIDALVPGCCAADLRKITADQVLEKLLYSLKMQQKEYRVAAVMQETVDESTGEVVKQPTGRYQQWKRELRPGDAARMLTVMSEQYVDRLTFAGGDGIPLRKKIQRDALGPLRDVQRRKRRDAERGTVLRGSPSSTR